MGLGEAPPERDDASVAYDVDRFTDDPEKLLNLLLLLGLNCTRNLSRDAVPTQHHGRVRKLKLRLLI